jgi:hypothetical protein
LAIGGPIEYENGAVVNTSFITNLDSAEVRSVPKLYRMIKEANDQNREEKVVQLPKYEYPDAVLTAAMVQRYSKYGVEYKAMPESCHFTRALNSQREVGKGIFGSGYLLSRKAAREKAAAEKAAAEKAARERAAAEKWTLSEAEIEIIRSLK